MQMSATLIFAMIMAGFGLLLAVYFWPSIALGIFIAIPLVKPAMVMRFNFMTGTIGYMFDTGIVVMAMIGITIYLFRTGQGVRILIPKSFWFCWLMLSILVWLRLPASRDPVSGFTRAMLFSIYNTCVLILGALCGSSTKSILKLTSSLITIGLIGTFALLIYGKPSHDYESARMTVAGAQVLALGDSIAYAVIVIMVFWLSKRRYILRKGAFILAGFALFAILLAGHRGALVGLAVTFLFIAIAYRKTHSVWTIVGGLILALILGFAVHHFFTTSAQASRFSQERVVQGIMDRVFRVKSALSEWSRSPVFGTGTGDTSFQISGTVGSKLHPHNIYLEILNELGVVGFVLYMGLFVHSLKIFKTAISYRRDNIIPREFLVAIASGLLYHILFGLKTSSYAGSFMLYFFMGASISLANYSCQQESLQVEQEYYDQMYLQEYDIEQ